MSQDGIGEHEWLDTNSVKYDALYRKRSSETPQEHPRALSHKEIPCRCCRGVDAYHAYLFR